MAYEVLTAFFLEAGFLGVMLFGMNRVGQGAAFHRHARGRASAPSSRPSGSSRPTAGCRRRPATRWRAGQFVPADWLAVIFNPSFPYRLVHTVLAAYLTTALVVGGVGAWHLLRDRSNDGARIMFSMAMGMTTVVAPMQILAGDQHGLNTLEHQPAKVMAMEGHFQSHPDGAPLVLFAWPDHAGRARPLRRRDPEASSLILKHSLDAPLKGLDTVAQATGRRCRSCSGRFRIMVGLGLLMLLLGARGACGARVRHGSTTGRCCIALPSPWGPRASSR